MAAGSSSQRNPDDCFVPQAGSQQLFMSCPIYEALYEGTRGPGKTITLLMDYAQHVGKGFGAAWRGILFRKHYKELEDAISKSKQWFPRIFPGAAFNESKTFWRFPGGEELLMRQFATPEDYWAYHGHEYPWIGWEELTTYADDQCYKVMMSCSRASHPGMPRKYRSTTNPYGRGHNWVKARFQLPGMRGRVIKTPGEPERVAIHGRLEENLALMRADPDYVQKIRAAARNPNELKAWLEGSWDITSGGMFDDIWDSRVHLLKPFKVPRTWRLDRSFDWGSSRPFSHGWWAVSDGSDVAMPDGRVLYTKAGDLFRIAEWYGWTGTPNVGLKLAASEVAQGIRDREAAMGIAGMVKPGPADSSIFDVEHGSSDKRSVAGDMQGKGVSFLRADKGPGSRKRGWEVMRSMMEAAKQAPRERSGAALYVFDTCAQFVRTVPVLTRSDVDPDDADTEGEDHVADDARYRCRWKPAVMMGGSF